MISKYLFRRLNKDEAQNGLIKTIPYNNYQKCNVNEFETRKMIANHIRCGSRKRSYPVISLTSSLNLVCKDVWESPYIAIITKACLNQEYLCDVSTVYNFKNLTEYKPLKSSMPQKTYTRNTEKWSQSRKEYCYLDNISRESYVVVHKEELKKILELIEESKNTTTIYSKIYSKINKLIDIHPVIRETRDNDKWPINDQLNNLDDVKKVYNELIECYLEDNYFDLNDLVEKKGFKIPTDNKQSENILQEIISECDKSYIMKQRIIIEQLIDNIFNNKKHGVKLFPYLKPR